MKLWWCEAMDADSDGDGDALWSDDGVAGASARSGSSSSSPPSSLASSSFSSSSSSHASTLACFDEARALAAVACADGPPDARERAAVAVFVGVVDDGVWRVWRPREVGRPGGLVSSQRALTRMVHVALADRDDGVLDDSERTLLRAFARAFGVDEGFVDRAVAATLPARGWSRLRCRASALLRSSPLLSPLLSCNLPAWSTTSSSWSSLSLSSSSSSSRRFRRPASSRARVPPLPKEAP
jgi:hypothetical protein